MDALFGLPTTFKITLTVTVTCSYEQEAKVTESLAGMGLRLVNWIHDTDTVKIVAEKVFDPKEHKK